MSEVPNCIFLHLQRMSLDSCAALTIKWPYFDTVGCQINRIYNILIMQNSARASKLILDVILKYGSLKNGILLIFIYLFYFIFHFSLPVFKNSLIKVKLATLVEGDLKAPSLIATTPRCRGGRYSFHWICSTLP